MPSLLVSAADLLKLNAVAASTARITWVDRYEAGEPVIVGDPDRALDGRLIVERFRFGNGLEVLLWPDATAPIFAYQTWFRVGSRHDPATLSGMAHFFEHLMFKATTTHPEGDYDRLMEQAGGHTNAATWVDWTYYKAKLPRWELDLVTALEADRMEHLALAPDMLEREREVVLNERSQRVDNDPDGRLSEALYREAFRVHPYGIPTIGWEADIRRIQLADCMDFYRTHYAPNSAVIVVVGDIVPRDVLAAIQARYGHLAASDVPLEATPEEPAQDAPRRIELRLPVAVARMQFAWRAPAAGSPEHAALEIANEILIGGDSSRLEVALAQENEFVTDVTGWVSSFAHPGLFELALTLRPDADPAQVEAALLHVVDEFASGRAPATAAELTKAKNCLEAGFYRGLADVGARARQLGQGAVALNHWQDLWAEGDRLNAVTLESLAAVVRETFQPHRLTTAIALPDGSVPPEAGAEDDEVGEDDA